jgi:hypothetical protein
MFIAHKPVFIVLGAITVAGCVSAPLWSTSPSGAHFDHVVIGAADLDQAIEAFEKATGVRATYGGKHPVGTHNALASLGDGSYIELIAPQTGVKAPPNFPQLAQLDKLTTVGWAVSLRNEVAFREQLVGGGFPLSEPVAGSRVTPTGTALQWRTFRLRDRLAGAPFFITWGSQSAHPSSSTPTGCKLVGFSAAGPDLERLERLRTLVALPVEVSKSASEQFTISLDCPKGKVVF